MEDVLDLYEAPYDPAYPMVCFDESLKQLIGEVREPIPPQPGTPARQDTEYQRNGVRDLMMICEPKRGWREVLVMERRTKVEFAHCMRHIVQCYPEAKVIRVVLDNLNTHKPASLYEAFPPEEARAIARKLEFHYTPKHGSWLNSAKPPLGGSPKLNWRSSPTCACRGASLTKSPCAERLTRTSASVMSRPLPSNGDSPRRMPAGNSPAYILAFQRD